MCTRTTASSKLSTAVVTYLHDVKFLDQLALRGHVLLDLRFAAALCLGRRLSRFPQLLARRGHCTLFFDQLAL